MVIGSEMTEKLNQDLFWIIYCLNFDKNNFRLIK